MENFANHFILTWENFEAVIQSHDWNYDYSDDHSRYKRGYNTDGWLQYAYTELCKTDPDRANLIWNRYAPFNRRRELNLF